jgi:hypothetical protein
MSRRTSFGIRLAVLAAGCAIGALSPTAAFGQCEREWTPGFGLPQPPLQGIIASVMYDAGDGTKLYVAGEATDGVGCQVMRWIGYQWETVGTFHTGGGGTITGLAVYDSGSGPQLYACGDFAEVNGDRDAPLVARWDGVAWHGVLSRTHTVGEDVVASMCVYDDGRGPALFMVGRLGLLSDFLRWNGTELTAASESELTLLLGSELAPMCVYDAGNGPELFITGNVYVEGVPGRVKAWNGSEWRTPFELSNALTISALAVHDPDGPGALRPRLIIGGDDLRSAQAPAQDVIAWDGTTLSILGNAPSGQVLTLCSVEEPGSRSVLYMGGGSFFGGTSNLARWDGLDWSPIPDAGLVTSLTPMDPPGGTAQLFVGTDGLTSPNRPAMVWDGSILSQLPAYGTTALRVTGVGVSAGDSPFFPAGFYSSAGRWIDGRSRPWPTGYQGIVDFPVLCDPDADGPLPRTLVGARSNAIYYWDGVAWMQLDRPFPMVVTALASSRDPVTGHDVLFVGGSHDSGRNVPLVGVWNGSAWREYRGITSNPETVRRFEAATSGPFAGVYAVGTFGRLGVFDAVNIARWDGQTWRPLGPATFRSVTDVAAHDPDGDGPLPQRLLAVGSQNDFTTGLFEWNGAAWAPVVSPISLVSLVSAERGGPGSPRDLFVTGNFTQIDGAPARNAAFLRDGEWNAMEAGIEWNQNSTRGFLELFDVSPLDEAPPDVFITGGTTRAGPYESFGIARWGCPVGLCRSDFDGNGQTDFFDYLGFTASFDAGDPRADFDANGQVDFFDYLDFAQAFAAGC